MKAVWSGMITVSLVNIPVKAYTSVSEQKPSFNQLHAKDEGRIRYKRVCTECGEEDVPYNDIVKGYEITKNEFVTLTKEELDNIPLNSTKNVEVSFVDSGEVDDTQYKQRYYLGCVEGGEKQYALLREAMKRNNKVAVGKITLRNKEHLAMVHPYAEGLAMTLLYYTDEIKDPHNMRDKWSVNPELSDEELELADKLITSRTVNTLDEFTDNYREALEELIKAKMSGESIADVKKEVEGCNDLIASLKASVEGS